MQHYLGVTGRRWADVAVLFLGERLFRIYRIHRDDELVGALFEEELRFWREHVQPRVPPEPRTIDDIRRRWPRHEPDKVLVAPPDVVDAAEQLAALRAELKALEAREKELLAAIQKAMGDAERLDAPDGRTLATWKAVTSRRLDTGGAPPGASRSCARIRAGSRKPPVPAEGQTRERGDGSMTDAAMPARRQDINSMIPRDFDQALKAAEVLAKSSIVPKDFQNNPGNVLVAIQWGMELGLPPLQAMQNIAVINGRPTLWDDAVLALVRASGLLEAIEEEVTDAGARSTVKRRGEAPVTREFTAEDAKRAELLAKAGPWQQYPKRMRQMRARAFALRDVFPDVLKGMAVAEEVADIDYAPAHAEGDGGRLVRGVAGLKARLLPKAEEDGDGAGDGATAKAAAEPKKTAEPKGAETPQQKKARKLPSRRRRRLRRRAGRCPSMLPTAPSPWRLPRAATGWPSTGA